MRGTRDSSWCAVSRRTVLQHFTAAVLLYESCLSHFAGSSGLAITQYDLSWWKEKIAVLISQSVENTAHRNGKKA